MDEKQNALTYLEEAFRLWYWATEMDMPDIGILVVGLNRNGCDLQYLGVDPDAIVDWPSLFQRILEQLVSRQYSVQPNAAVNFPSQR